MHFQGQRQKKLEAKKIRDDIEEEEKKQMDLEEAKFQELKRKEAIERAKTMQYYQIDRVKGFHVSILIFLVEFITFFNTYTLCNIIFYVISFTEILC